MVEQKHTELTFLVLDPHSQTGSIGSQWHKYGPIARQLACRIVVTMNARSLVSQPKNENDIPGISVNDRDVSKLFVS